MSELKALKSVYKKLDDNYTNAKDSFYDTENNHFHLIVSAECLAIAECKMIIADEIVKQLEQEASK
jgi:hypothetical protein